jgi:hypothetical protein
MIICIERLPNEMGLRQIEMDCSQYRGARQRRRHLTSIFGDFSTVALALFGYCQQL